MFCANLRCSVVFTPSKSSDTTMASDLFSRSTTRYQLPLLLLSRQVFLIVVVKSVANPQMHEERRVVMLKVNGILETALYVEDTRRAAEFYQKVFGFEMLGEPGERLAALNVREGQVLLLFKKGASV